MLLSPRTCQLCAGRSEGVTLWPGLSGTIPGMSCRHENEEGLLRVRQHGSRVHGKRACGLGVQASTCLEVDCHALLEVMLYAFCIWRVSKKQVFEEACHGARLQAVMQRHC